jgi:hypothetical protein
MSLEQPSDKERAHVVEGEEEFVASVIVNSKDNTMRVLALPTIYKTTRGYCIGRKQLIYESDIHDGKLYVQTEVDNGRGYRDYDTVKAQLAEELDTPQYRLLQSMAEEDGLYSMDDAADMLLDFVESFKLEGGISHAIH